MWWLQVLVSVLVTFEDNRSGFESGKVCSCDSNGEVYSTMRSLQHSTACTTYSTMLQVVDVQDGFARVHYTAGSEDDEWVLLADRRLFDASEYTEEVVHKNPNIDSPQRKQEKQEMKRMAAEERQQRTYERSVRLTVEKEQRQAKQAVEKERRQQKQEMKWMAAEERQQRTYERSVRLTVEKEQRQAKQAVEKERRQQKQEMKWMAAEERQQRTCERSVRLTVEKEQRQAKQALKRKAAEERQQRATKARLTVPTSGTLKRDATDARC
jgi:HSP20 family molecular chaperone IbpA